MSTSDNPSIVANNWRIYAYIEPPLVLYLFAQALTGAVVTDLMVFRSCQYIHFANQSVCDILHTASSSKEAAILESEAQSGAAYVLMCKSLLDGILPAFLSFFLGPWSDKYGRKPLMVAGYSGSALSFLLWTILCTLEMDSRLYLLTSLPTALMGGFCGLMLASLCFITDIRKDGDRAWHLTWLQILISLGIFFGTFCGSAIFKEFGYPTVFGVACACSSLATLYVIYFVPETIIRVPTDTQKFWFNSLFDVSLVKDMFMTCTKRRDGFDRVVAWSCIACLSLNFLVMEGDLGIGFMFASAKFGWDVSDYSTYQATTVFLAIVGTLMGAKIFQTFVDEHMLDARIAIFANVSSFAGAMTRALAMKPWHLYLSTLVTMFAGLSSPVLRAILSKCGPPQDAGKIFSLTTSMESVVPLAASPLYTLIYTRNMPPVYPAPVYLISAGFFAGIIILIVAIDRQMWKTRDSRYVSVEQQAE